MKNHFWTFGIILLCMNNAIYSNSAHMRNDEEVIQKLSDNELCKIHTFLCAPPPLQNYITPDTMLERNAVGTRSVLAGSVAFVAPLMAAYVCDHLLIGTAASFMTSLGVSFATYCWYRPRMRKAMQSAVVEKLEGVRTHKVPIEGSISLLRQTNQSHVTAQMVIDTVASLRPVQEM